MPEDLYDYVTKTEKKNAYKKERAIEEEERRAKKAIKALEESIETLESEISEIENQMADPENAKDYEKIMDFDAERLKKQEELDLLYEQWMEIE